MSGEADVILVPKADMEAMRKASRQMQESLEKAGQQAAADTEKELGDGVKKGIDKGSDEGFSKLSLGIASFALALGSVIKDALDKTLGGADEVVEDVKRRAENIKNMTGNAGAFGIDQGEYAAFSVGAGSLGIDEDTIRGMLAGFAGALDSDEMVKYRNVSDEKGLDTAFYKLLNTASFMDPAKAITWLSTSGQLGDDATYANKMAGVMRSMREGGVEVNKRNFFTEMAGFDINPEKLSKSFDVALVQIAKMSKANAEREYDVLLHGTTEAEANSVNSREKSKAKLEDTELESITLKVKTANFQDKVDIAEMNATVAAFDVAEKVTKELEESVRKREELLAKVFETEVPEEQQKLAARAGYSRDQYVTNVVGLEDLISALKQVFSPSPAETHSRAIADSDVEIGGD